MALVAEQGAAAIPAERLNRVIVRAGDREPGRPQRGADPVQSPVSAWVTSHSS
jgi:hypothetical protein